MVNARKFYAHTLENQPPEHWEQLHEHEQVVASLCAKFLKRIHPGLEECGDLLGRWHDLGKYSDEFQVYLAKANNIDSPSVHAVEVSGKVDHSTAAAQLSLQKFGKRGRLFAYPFAGHHAGLPDWDDGISQSGLRQRLHKEIHDFEINTPIELLDVTFPRMPKFPLLEKDEYFAQRAAFRVGFWIRMIFSGLVDADFLATESFMSPDRKKDRPPKDRQFSELCHVLESAIALMESEAEQTDINFIRKAISAECLTKASLPPGIFSLNVPTGGGKTIAGLRFALNHAIQNDLERVIVAIPFTSIIEQNADVYRDIFDELGSDVVLEHHSNLDPKKETTTNRLQAENWDAPIVVTTNVQFFESLFSTRTSRCRKLHRIANSVIILDEAQTLPVELLKPTLFAIQELVEVYNCTFVLCTATQPALNHREDFKIGLKHVTPIINDPVLLHQKLKRVEVSFVGELSDEDLSTQIDKNNQVLCILNTRPYAAKIFESLGPSEGDFHLTTRMCAAHRKQILYKEIRPRLKSGQKCRVISTQLIEAGVDVDFPVVFRAIAGLDSLAQAAGRCNREGMLQEQLGKVYFFEPETPPPPGMLRQTANSARELLDEYESLLSPEAIEHYFELHYWKKSDSWDKHQVLDAFGNQPDRMEFNFREAAEKYRFIRDTTQTIIVPWGKGEELVNQMADPFAKLFRKFWRELQRFGIQVRDHEFVALQHAGAIELRHERWVLVHNHLYDSKQGLVFGCSDGNLPVDSMII